MLKKSIFAYFCPCFGQTQKSKKVIFDPENFFFWISENRGLPQIGVKTHKKHT